jgi:hypothetical protein
MHNHLVYYFIYLSLLKGTFGNQKRLLHIQQKLNVTLIGLVNGSPISKVPFTFCTFFSQNVAFVGMFPFNFSTSGKSKTFFSSGVCLHFWHNPTN